MKVSHPAVTSTVFEMVKVVELDLQLAEDAWSVRIEIMQDTEASDRFRCHVWEQETFRLTPTFPQNRQGRPCEISDDRLLVERGIAHRRIAYPREDILAADANAALEVVLQDLQRFLRHACGEDDARVE